MSGRYRYEPSNGWLWILPPVGPSFASVYEKSASGADSNSRAVREIVIELNRLLDRAEKAETALADATQAHANERYQLQNAAIVAVEAQRKAEARVAELRTMLDEATDRSDLHFNNLSRTLANQRDEKQAHALTVAKLQARVAELERDVPVTARCQHCGTLNEAPTARWEAGFVCGCGRRIAKTAPKTPVPAPEPTETVQSQAPAAGTDPSRHDPPARGVAAGVEPAPVLGDPRGSDPRRGCWPCYRDRAKGYASCPIHKTVDLTKPQTLRAYATFGEARSENAISLPLPPQRGLTAEEADAYTELLGKATTRVEASPEQAAEVEARTGEWAGLTRLFWAGSEGLSEDAIRATLTVQRPPRAGLPSRDEVAAFLEARWPK